MATHILAVLVVIFNLYFVSTQACEDHLNSTKACGAHWSLEIGDSKNFSSPNYPSPYPGGTDCRWTASIPEHSIINVVCPKIDVLKGKLACIDLFYIAGHEENGRYAPLCGEDSPGRVKYVNITTKSFEAYFTSEDISHNTSTGFTCTVTVLEARAISDEHPCCECGKNTHHNRIVGGEEAEIHEWPWQVALHAERKGKWFDCGGSLISPNWILTAAHCVDDASKIVAVLGEHEKKNYTETNMTANYFIDMNNVIIHAGYNNKGKNSILINDIAVLKLLNPLEYNHGVSPVCLPINLRNKIFDGESATVTGWGKTAFTGNVSNTLLEATLSVISNTECTRMLNQGVYDDQICTYKEGKLPCQGDSGGALVWLDESGRYQQIGIVSFGEKCALKDEPSVYTRVTSFVDWIYDKTGIHRCSS